RGQDLNLRPSGYEPDETLTILLFLLNYWMVTKILCEILCELHVSCGVDRNPLRKPCNALILFVFWQCRNESASQGADSFLLR
ncbi:hypothetical protein, partial [Hyphomonas sp. UBA3201]|uniref:hypothetical protein n=1 Tax=Hyphomonas sp. UBA3201 TaxID=1946623 RepID=UPI0025B83D25